MWQLFGAAVAANVVGRVLFSGGIGLITFSGLQYILSEASTQLQGAVSGLPADVVGLAGLAGIDLAINLIFSAYSARLAMSTLIKFAAVGLPGS